VITDVLNARIREYAPASAIEQENVLQELMQQLVLVSLSRAGMFAEAVFHGGTCLRIVHGMSRFSEDLDFLLKRPDPGFRWRRYLEAVGRDCALQGIELELQDKSAADVAVQKAFLKTDSVGKVLLLALPFERPNPRKIRIKLEIDTNPPAGSAFQTSYVTFPGIAAITTQTLSSGFGTKAHALLCRRYVKGRDWYDFVWYTSRRVKPDLDLLQNALFQQGPWAGQPLTMTPAWLIENLGALIREVDWGQARMDLQRFLPTTEQAALDSWGTELFLYQLEQMKGYLRGD